MNKSQLINAVAEDLSLPRDDVKRVVDSLLKIAVDTLSSDEKVVLSGFGMFSVVHVPERMKRNPRTGESVRVEPHRNVRFRSRMVVK